MDEVFYKLGLGSAKLRGPNSICRVVHEKSGPRPTLFNSI